MASNEEIMEVEDSNGDSYGNKVKQRFRDPSKKVAQTKEMLSKQAVQTKEILSKQAIKIAKQAEEHERFINKVTHLLGVLGFGGFCFILGARPQDVRYLYCVFYVIFVPLRWIYYRYKKWHYYLLDFCYYANTIFLIMLLCYPTKEKLFMVCFSFAEGPLAWALIIWRCSLVFNSMDKIVSVFIHLLPGLVFFTIRWWDPVFFEAMHPEGTARKATWPYAENKLYLWTWLFFVPLVAYVIWQLLYFLIVNVLRRQRFLRDPEVMTSYRELSKKAQKANNMWWRLSGVLGDQNRMFMYILLQAMFTVATTALTVPIFLSYELHVTFQLLKVSATVWNGGNFLLEVMPRQVILKEKKKKEMQPVEVELNLSVPENSTKSADSPEVIESQ
ncbi:membrane protein [Perilla frutescens var. hirtella]|uniref:Glycerophosphocholine acyltransferase 1 n=1 Tax=Perilla frutescens var. hirtella TaxID=608512 RepID=A0AAD4J8V6_PERFH|nr:membrane protein [Perilla frutescens var. frutescens]KAH6829337.1 membrane protein [Perilla frutescens var. hirtella]